MNCSLLHCVVIHLYLKAEAYGGNDLEDIHEMTWSVTNKIVQYFHRFSGKPGQRAYFCDTLIQIYFQSVWFFLQI